MEASPSTKPVFVVVGGGIAGVSCAEEVRVYYCVKECKNKFPKRTLLHGCAHIPVSIKAIVYPKL